MATKGASFRYGNTNGSRTEHIRFAWAKGFNRGGLERHFHDHGKEFGATTAEEYVSKAVHFANTVDRKHFKSVVDCNGTTYKYDIVNHVLALIDKKGYVISYYRIADHFTYVPKKGRGKKTVWIKK
ncbi:MAG TPA: hypothetical protein DDW18_01185 [Firmicutes bacterium]|nr:hypothetical protein [Bacillota bacterium]HBN00295.1 hypothetical protein [Bacillota bacterium]